MFSTLRVGLIGLGTMGTIHAKNLIGRIPGVVLAAVTDPLLDILDLSFLESLSIRKFHHYQDLLELSDLDAVVIAAASTSHAEILKAAAVTRKPVFCEKPLSLTLDDALSIHHLFEHNHIPLQMGFMRRFDPHYLTAKELIDSGRIGRPYGYHGISRDRVGPPASVVQYSGGFHLDTGVHEFDLVRWLLNTEIVSVFSRGDLYNHQEYQQFRDVDHTHLSLRCASGALGVVELSRDAVYGYDIRTEVLGTNGAIQVAPVSRSGTALLVDGQIIADTYRDYRDRFQEAYLNEMREFLGSVREGRAVPIGSLDGIRATLVAETGIRSLSSGRDELVASPV